MTGFSPDLTSLADLEDALPQTTRLLSKAFRDMVERQLVKAMSEIEGGPITPQLAKAHGDRLVYHDGRQEFRYRDVLILEIPAYPIEYKDGIITFIMRVPKPSQPESVVKP